MKIHGLFQALLALVLLACAFGAQGQYSMPTSGYSTAAPTNQYAATTGSAPSTHISAPVHIDLIGKIPTILSLGTQNQEVPYSEYMSNPANAGIVSLWAQSGTRWVQTTTVSQGASVSLIAISATGGSGYLNEMHPDGTMSSSNLYFYPGSSEMNFYADAIGRHILSIVINGKTSNTVIIDVTGTYVPPRNYLPPRYYPNYGYGGLGGLGFSPGFVGFDGERGEFGGEGGEFGEGEGGEFVGEGGEGEFGGEGGEVSEGEGAESVGAAEAGESSGRGESGESGGDRD